MSYHHHHYHHHVFTSFFGKQEVVWGKSAFSILDNSPPLKVTAAVVIQLLLALLLQLRNRPGAEYCRHYGLWDAVKLSVKAIAFRLYGSRRFLTRTGPFENDVGFCYGLDYLSPVFARDYVSFCQGLELDVGF